MHIVTTPSDKRKIGCCTNMIAGLPDGTGAEHAPDLAAFGYDYLELPLAEIMQLSAAEFDRFRNLLERQSINCEACNNFFPRTMRLTGPDVDMPKIIAYVDSALARAAILGSACVVFGSGPAKTVPADFPLEKGYAQIVSLLQKIAPLAAAHGITIAIEPLRKAECNLINTFSEGCRLAVDAGCEEVKVLVDFYHLTEESEPLDNLRAQGALLHHVHFANPAGRVFPAQGDLTDYGPFLRVLDEIEYSGRISVEALTDNFQSAGPRALALLKR